jgi:adenosylcobyric acid synthase
MAVARYAQAPVLLVGDIDRGGIFAQLIGTVWLLEPEERALVRGLVVNKFRGDPALFVDGVRILEDKAGVPVLGVVPYLRDLYLPEEDAVAIDQEKELTGATEFDVDVAVIHLPCIANFDDFDPLLTEPGVRLRYVDSPEALGQPDAIILPGTKSTAGDLEWLRQRGLARLITDFAQKGGAVAGICGGYQMLGEAIYDPEHIETSAEQTPGLGLLPTTTRFVSDKATYRARASVQSQRAWLAPLAGQTVEGYEIHMGITEGNQPWLKIADRNGTPVEVSDGSLSASGRVWGCYLHGLFGNENLRHAWLTSLGWKGGHPATPSAAARFTQSLARLGEAVEAALDMKRLETILSDE